MSGGGYFDNLNPSSVFLLIIVEAFLSTTPPEISTTVSAMALKLGTIVHGVK